MPGCPWERAIALADMNAFFCSIEQMDHPEWQGKPIGVTNGEIGTCIITCSYEARAWGIRTGMRVKQARAQCPGFIQVAARPERYAEVSTNIMHALIDITPDVEVFSVDEAFLDVTRCQHLHGPPQQIARLIKNTIHEASGGLLCSVGISGDRTTAKYAAKKHKPDGLTVIPPWQAQAVLAPVKVTELCGISTGIGRFLADRGVEVCADMVRLPISELGRRFGNPGRRIWLMCQGLDPAPINPHVPDPQSVGHGKVMPPDTTDPEVIRTFLLHMASKVGARLRRHQLHASRFFIGLRAALGWLGGKYPAPFPTHDSAVIRQLCEKMLAEQWHGEGVYQVQVTALDPFPGGLQRDLFKPERDRADQLNAVVDAINHRYGEFALAPARLLLRSSMPNVIAPAWKPFGHRETILKK
ncbi:MAG: DNA polymerase IV [Sedimenticola sp.]|nr:MAG: DNA polymerase IV [Sedimenticola sp.]